LTFPLRRLTITAFTAFSLFASTTSTQAETLSDALVSAYDTSGLLQQNRAVLRAADEGVAQAVAALRPALSYALQSRRQQFEGISGAEFIESATLSLSLPIYQFGRGRLAIEAQKETVLATREALVGVEQQVLLRAVQAYMNVRRDADFVNLSHNNVRLITEELRAARDRFEVGEITRTDVSLAEARLASARANLAAREGGFQVSREEYRAAVGHYPVNLSVPPAAPSTAATLEAAQAVARGNHPDLKRAQRDVTVTELNLAATERRMLPSVDLSADATLIEDSPENGSIALRIAGPIYQGGQLKSLQRQAMAQRDSARAAILLTGQSVQQNVGNAWANRAVSHAQIQASDREIRASRAAWEGVREEARLGARTTLDVLNAEQDLLDARSNLVAAQSDSQVAAYALLSAMGLLTVKHLNLGVQTYDPADYYNAVSNAPNRPTSEQGERLDALLRSLAGGGN